MVLSQLSSTLRAPHICDPADQFMHRISEGFVQQPPRIPRLSALAQRYTAEAECRALPAVAYRIERRCSTPPVRATTMTGPLCATSGSLC